MKKAALVVNAPYNNNNVFDKDNMVLNRDNCLYHYYLLREEFEKNDVDLSTSDLNTPEKSEFIIYADMPDILPKTEDINKSYLIINESQIIKKQNWQMEKHKYFEKIFTWNDSFVDNKKYFKVNPFPVLWDKKYPDYIKKEKLCVIISGNKNVKAPNELYSERVKAIRWFEKNNPEDFDLYGVGWEKSFSGKLTKHFNRSAILKKIFAPFYPSYKGRVDKKREILSKYKFSICYENASDITGYITEKIIDCFVSACVPIYWGAPNITDFIPSNCFIDKRDFGSYEDIYKHITSMQEKEYAQYLINIKSFLESSSMQVFSPHFFSKTIVNEILK